MTPFARLLDQGQQQHGPDAFASPFLQYRHASDVAVGQQAPRPDRRISGVIRERMLAARVLLVPLQLQRHALLAHEHEFADAARLRPGFVPVAQADGK